MQSLRQELYNPKPSFFVTTSKCLFKVYVEKKILAYDLLEIA